MITEGLQYTTPDGTLATLHAGRADGTWNVETDSSTLWGITTVEAEQHVHAAAAAINRKVRELAEEIAIAWDAALAENAKRNRKLAGQKHLVPGTEHPRYKTCEASAELMQFIEAHYCAITAGVKSLAQFRANYADAGHAYVDGMEGVRQCGEKAWFDTFTIRLDGTPIPDALLLEIATLQVRCGIRDGQQSSAGRTKGIYCNCLAWELIRRGAKIGPRG